MIYAIVAILCYIIVMLFILLIVSIKRYFELEELFEQFSKTIEKHLGEISTIHQSVQILSQTPVMSDEQPVRDFCAQVITMKKILDEINGEIPTMIKEDNEQLKLRMSKYFTKETQIAIVDYKKAETQQQKNIIYSTRIAHSFEKLVENLINVYKFDCGGDFDSMKNDCVSFLFESISKFDETRGTNAFSYFNIVAKNWLTIKSKQYQQSIKTVCSLDDSNLSTSDKKFVHTSSFYKNLFSDADRDVIIEILHKIKSEVKNSSEENCINAIIKIFDTSESLDAHSKRATFIFIREYTNLNQKQLVAVMQSIKKIYKRIKSSQ